MLLQEALMSRVLMLYSTMICHKTMNIIFTVSAELDVPEKKALPITLSVAENRNRNCVLFPSTPEPTLKN